MDTSKVVYPELSYQLVGILFKTHADLGMYRNEKQYGDYLERLFQDKGTHYIREYRFEDQQYGMPQKIRCVVDFISRQDYYQIKRYLVTLNLHLGILVNFKQLRLAPKRVLNSDFYRN